MTTERAARMRAYARLIIQGGVNLQDGQALNVVAELGHRDFVRMLTAEAYDLGARLVEVRWFDPLSTRARYRDIRPEFLDYVPEYEASWRTEMLEYPHGGGLLDPAQRPHSRLGPYVAAGVSVRAGGVKRVLPVPRRRGRGMEGGEGPGGAGPALPAQGRPAPGRALSG